MKFFNSLLTVTLLYIWVNNNYGLNLYALFMLAKVFRQTYP
jgi:hypothetical protein